MTRQIKYVGPILMLLITLIILVVTKPNFVETNGNLSLVKAGVISIVVALLLAVALYFIPM